MNRRDTDDDTFISESDLQAAMMEVELHSTLTKGEIAQRVLEDNVIHAALTLIKIMQNSGDAKLRFAAAKEVLNRGLLTEGGPTGLEKFLHEIQSKVH